MLNYEAGDDAIDTMGDSARQAVNTSSGIRVGGKRGSDDEDSDFDD